VGASIANQHNSPNYAACWLAAVRPGSNQTTGGVTKKRPTTWAITYSVSNRLSLGGPRQRPQSVHSPAVIGRPA